MPSALMACRACSFERKRPGDAHRLGHTCPMPKESETCHTCSKMWEVECPACHEKTCWECTDDCGGGSVMPAIFKDWCKDWRCNQCLQRCKHCKAGFCELCLPRCSTCKIAKTGSQCVGCSMMFPLQRCQDCVVLQQQSTVCSSFIKSCDELRLRTVELPEALPDEIEDLMQHMQWHFARNIFSTRPVSKQPTFDEHRPNPPNAYVWLLRFSRSPLEFRETLLTAVELPNTGAKVFVKPEVYQAVMEEVRLIGLSLCRKDVFVDPILKDDMIKLVRSLPSRLSVQYRGARVCPLGFASACLTSEFPIEVKGSFIRVRVPTSLCSSSIEGQRAASLP